MLRVFLISYFYNLTVPENDKILAVIKIKKYKQ